MKHFLHFLVVLFAVTAIDYSMIEDMSWTDSRDDQSRTYFTIYYADGQKDVILMKKKDVDTSAMQEVIDQVLKRRMDK